MSEKSDRPSLSLVSGAVSLADGAGEVGEFPRTFGNYLLLSPLGQGGMGDVYLSKIGGIAGIEKHCVLKTLRPQFTDDREYVSRFIDEARVVVTLSHKNICSVFDVGQVEGRYYLAMEYIAGRDLKTLVASAAGIGEKVGLGIVLYIVSEVLEALDYAHRHIDHGTGEPMRIVHRDVSPANVMVSFEGEVKLIDFGLAASTLKLERTEPNVVMGKVAYMAPEQVRGEAVDGRSDTFAVGVMLYELLTGERYYEGKTPYEIWSLAGAGTFKPRRWQTLDAELRAILTLALAPNRDERYKSAADMRESIEVYRVHHALRGSTLALRELVERTMADEISESRSRLARFKNVKLLRTTSPPQASSSQSSPSQSAETGAVRTDIGPNDDTIRAPRGDAFAGQSRVPFIAAAVVAVAALAALVVALAWRATPAVEAGPVAAVETAPVAPVVEPPAPPAEKTAEAAAAEAAAAAEKAAAEKAAAEKPIDKPVSRPRTKSSGGGNSKPAARATTNNPVLDSIIARCPTLACTKPLEQMAPQVRAHLGDKDKAWLTTWKQKLSACRDQCP